VEAARLKQHERELKDTHDTVNTPEMEEFFVLDAENALSVLEEIEITNKLDGDDLELYIITVHGMKSTLANVGEKELSSMAFRLEQAGDKKNFIQMSNETPVFMDEIKALIEKFKPEKEDGSTDITEEDAAYLKEKMIVIKNACIAFDKNGAKAALSDLRKREWPNRISSVLDNITLQLLHSSFKAAAEMAEEASIKADL
jgi:HPt (histidine-containing phosphotransfer) domain-containing protein